MHIHMHTHMHMYMYMSDTSTDGITHASKQQGFMSNFLTKCAYIHKPSTTCPTQEPQPTKSLFAGYFMYMYMPDIAGVWKIHHLEFNLRTDCDIIMLCY